ncbi:MAG: acyltransferase [Candidatus Magnetominusculus sp. LBB02]|nr:acyltransferase [Candidatus Magnetominusculus sp. LBB02]
MFDLLAIVTRKKYWRLHSVIIEAILRFYGIKVGSGFYIEGTPRLKIAGKASNISIGNNVSIFGNIDIRNRENGSIVIEDDVKIDNDCRFVAANEAVLTIGRGTGIGPYCIFNCGVDVTVGQDCLIAHGVHVQSSEHKFAKGELIRNQGHTYGKIVIGNDVWLAANVTVAKGAEIGSGCVVGAKSLVRKGRYEENSIIVGTPAKKISERGSIKDSEAL